MVPAGACVDNGRQEPAPRFFVHSTSLVLEGVHHSVNVADNGDSGGAAIRAGFLSFTEEKPEFFFTEGSWPSQDCRYRPHFLAGF
jgi:hypothetical protein